MIDYTALEEKLTGPYKEALKTVELYGLVKNIDTDVQDEMMMNLYDLLLSAQEDGKPVEKIVGKDLEAFCENYYQEYNSKERIKLLPKRIYSLAKMILIIEILEVIFTLDSGSSFFQVQTDISPYIMGVIGGASMTYILELLFTPTLYKWKKRNTNLYYGITSAVFIGGIAGCIWISEKIPFSVKAYPVILISLVYVAVYLIVRSIYRYKKYGTIKKGKKPGEEYKEFSYSETIKKEFSYGATIQENVEKQLPGELVKRYEKINRKRRKKGKPEMTPEEFEKFLKEETDKLSKTKGIRLFFIIFTLLVIIITAFTSEPLDTLIFAVIVSSIELFTYRTWKKGNDKIVKVRREVLENCKKAEKNIVEYAKDIEEKGV